ncbi:MAG TPA: TaqI-like C-terminal specificity domain-containing protein [Ignavibacteria bacterium]
MNFHDPYKREDYKVFFQNQFLTDNFKINEEDLQLENPLKYIKQVLLIGEDDSLDLKVIEARHDSENDPRVGLSRDIFRLMSSYGYRRALVLLYSTNSKNYRLSLVTIELSIEETKIKREYSNPRRYSFFLGPDAKVRTPYEFLIKKGRVKDFDDLQSRFSIEVVTKQFYQEIANWYFWAMDMVEFPDDEEKDKKERNAKNLIRLITRIIFVWFMKEKKLIPSKLFEKDFIDKIINYKDKTNSTYYKAILQNLFFATLNTPMKKDNNDSRIFIEDAPKRDYFNDGYLEQGYYRYKRFIKDTKLFLEQLENVPFLNGGLFECLDKKIDGKEIRVDCFSDNPKNETRLKVPDKIFFLEEEIEVDLSKYFENNGNKKVTGLLSILKKYNFTIDENTPIDQDIALDPELLGKVFENLLASYNPETDTTARKASGSYYTPREIVDYMVNESLIEYMKNYVLRDTKNIIQSRDNSIAITNDWDALFRNLFDYTKEENPFDKDMTLKVIDAIERIKILDPACGSGAFPMGILHKLVLALHKLDPENKIWKKKLLDRVPYEIRNETEKSLQNKSIDYIRKLGLIENCIYGVDIQEIAIQISKLRFFISLLVEQQIDDTKPNRDIRALPNLETKFVAANTLIGLKRPAQLTLNSSEIENLEKELFKTREEIFYTNSRTEKLKLQKIEKELRDKLKTALKKNGFQNDVAEKITGWDPFDQNTHSDWFDPEWMFGVKVNESPELKENTGFDIVIGNPPYIQLQRAINERTKLKYADLYKNQNFKTFERTGDIYCLFYEKGIELLSYEGHLLYITSNKWMRAGYGEALREFFIKYNPKKLIDLGPGIFESATVDTSILIIQKANNQNQLRAITLQKEAKDNISNALAKYGVVIEKLTKDAWFIGSSDEQKLKEKIDRIGKPLKDWDVQIYRGVLTGLNEAFIITTEKRKEILANCKTDDERKRTKAIIKPILRGRDIKRYYYEWAGLWVIFIHAGWTDENKGKKDPEKFINDVFPSLMKHLKYFEKKAKKRDDQGDYWWELRPCTYYHEFEKEKVVWGNIAYSSEFCFVDKGIFINAPANIIISDNTSLKYLVASMNSKAFDWQFKQIGIFLGHAYEWKKQYVEQVKIPPITQSNQPIVTQIESLVDQILDIKKQNPQADTSHLERDIDKLVYRLYDLTENEIKIVEGNIK